MKIKTDKYLEELKEKNRKIQTVYKNFSCYGNFNWDNDCNSNILFWNFNLKR